MTMLENLTQAYSENSDSSAGTDTFSQDAVAPEISHRIIKPVKSYDNTSWLHSRSARHIRIMCEYLEVQDRLRRANIVFTFLVFGSARGMSSQKWEEKYSEYQKKLSNAVNEGNSKLIESIQYEIVRLERLSKICVYWDKTYELCKLLTAWCLKPEARKALSKIFLEMPTPAISPVEVPSMVDTKWIQDVSKPSVAAVCTGGGHGFMEAANKGAADVPGGRSMGMGISLPFEQGLNGYINDDLAFEFHYFFTRKFWMVYTALAVVATPGGLGTLDELMEVLTLKQSGKLKRDIPFVLLGKEFWESCLNFDVLIEHGTISASDKEQLFITDDPVEAFNHIKEYILTDKLILGDSHVHKSRRTYNTQHDS